MKNPRLICLVLSYWLLSHSLLTNAHYADHTVNFLNWSEYIAPDIIHDFYQATHIKVNQDYFDDPNELKAKLMSSNNGYDLVVPALSEMQEEIPAHLFAPLDKTRLSHYSLLDKTLMQQVAAIDKGNTYALIYTWGTTGIGYNIDLVKKVLGPNVKIDDWNVLFDPRYLRKLKQCGVSFLETPYLVYSITLHYLGLNPNSHLLSDYVKATDYLMSIRGYLTYFSSSNYNYDLASGNLCMVMGYSGDILRAKMYADKAGNGVHIAYVIPKSGAPLWFDMMAIPKDAPHKKEALAFMDYLITPKAAAAISNFIFQPNATPSAKPYLIRELQDPNVTPDANTIKHLFQALVPPLELNQEMNRQWLQVRYGIH